MSSFLWCQSLGFISDIIQTATLDLQDDYVLKDLVEEYQLIGELLAVQRKVCHLVILYWRLCVVSVAVVGCFTDCYTTVLPTLRTGYSHIHSLKIRD